MKLTHINELIKKMQESFSYCSVLYNVMLKINLFYRYIDDLMITKIINHINTFSSLN